MKTSIYNIRTIVIILFLALFIFVSCQSSKPVINQVFNEREANNINRIIDFYDVYILSYYKDSIPIDKAYKQFISYATPIAENEGDLSLFIPPDSLLIPFINSLDKEAMSEICALSDSVKFYGIDTVLKVPYNFSFRYRSKFVQEYLKKLSSRNKILNDYYDSFIKAGDISPVTYYFLMFEYDIINFNDRDERFAFIAAFFFRNPISEFQRDLMENRHKCIIKID
ncbi:MAG: hypothetical protein H6Q16_1014 [Bacteroidetes bacterium]|nr:hypothetical protein [Bacteroidota bacterium]